MSGPAFLREDPWPSGVVQELGRFGGVRLRRLRCANPGPFTFLGTNSYIIGEGEVALLDPGPEDAAHHAALLAAIGGEQLTKILVSHTHRDHSPGAAALAAATGARSYGFGPHQTPPEAGGEGGDHEFRPDVTLADGAVVDGAGWRLMALHTPGHCANHLCFALRDSGVLFSADHVMSWSTSVVSPPDGDMAAYMAGLERLAARDEALFLPGHGAPLEQPQDFTRALLAHRLEREAKVLAALRAAGPASAEALVPAVYGALDARLVPAAGRSLLAHLLKLEDEGQVTREGGRWIG
ncbi:MBL fold metallo-hydrolase [Pseudoroseomonas cervicalis]|uniref:MBL fold metallo-hydrolase n=1 Tax=Teichococcus cervicalis TaxID=204525 RepID=UPI00278280AB|nr:MBL fold metallo-hydrolase [Pseudoroseomonas cervicalis]MDQ1081745.1 glyoxylase-like metal-dependent hydrolase (beta-lactamase superfamily II) [Pseudoroseomonas cervicalis]